MSRGAAIIAAAPMKDRYSTEVVLRPYNGNLVMLDGRGNGDQGGGQDQGGSYGGATSGGGQDQGGAPVGRATLTTKSRSEVARMMHGKMGIAGLGAVMGMMVAEAGAARVIYEDDLDGTATARSATTGATTTARRSATTNTVSRDPAAPKSRQVRRQEARLAAKGRRA